MARLLTSRAARLLFVDGVRTAMPARARRLAAAGYRVDRAHGWRQGLLRAVSDDYRVIVVDQQLPQVDGLGLTQILRGCGQEAPVLLLSATGGEAARREALAAGADDLLAEPFGEADLVARVAALARRPPKGVAPTLLRVGDLQLDLMMRTAARAGRPIRLSRLEFNLLARLARNHGRVVPRAALLRAAWGRRHEPAPRRLETILEGMRAKVDHGFPASLIHPVPGVGYVLLDED
jgi:two-component system OmpR family response regulator